jgi:hypothetical protein
MSTTLREKPDAAPVRAPEEPAVIGRLPSGVEYSYVKFIILALPSPLYVAPWLPTEADDPTWSMFRGKTFRALDRALRRREEQVAAPKHLELGERELADTQMLRHLWVQHVLAAIGQWDPTRRMRWLTIRFMNQPPGMAPAPKIVTRAWVLEVWGADRRTTRLLDRSVVPPAVPPWGDERVQYYEPQLIDGLTAAIVRRHFPEVMRQRIGRGWRSERNPSGWPMLLRQAIPALYDYLRPFYVARPYRTSLTSPTRGDYPTRLLQDIVDILRLELPHLTSELTVERVQAAVQRHIRRAAPKRSMGADLFTLPRTDIR